MSQETTKLEASTIRSPKLVTVFNPAVHCFAVPYLMPEDEAVEKRVWVDRLMQTNCYSYALGIPDHGKAIPGQLMVGFYKRPPNSEFTVEGMRLRLLHDGLSPVDDIGAVPKSQRVIAAFLAPGFDVHFYRRELDGTWSHKPGNEFVSQFDKSGMAISDPMTADRGIYKECIGFFSVESFRVAFYPHLSLLDDDCALTCEEVVSVPPFLAYAA